LNRSDIARTYQGDRGMRQCFILAVITSILASGFTVCSASNAAAGCRMEQQCRWVNYKKVCTYVRVCR
jgi:hypothetical protein